MGELFPLPVKGELLLLLLLLLFKICCDPSKAKQVDFVFIKHSSKLKQQDLVLHVQPPTFLGCSC